MENSPNQPAATAEDATLRRYRCVCSVSFDFEPAASRTCPNCGRRYDPQVFADKLADTMTFAGEMIPRTPVVSPESDPLIGTTRGHYRIVSRLGEGGMGSVYQAVDESLQRYVALKVIRQQDEAGTHLFEQLRQEARAQARVNHPNVVHIYYVGQTEDAPFFAMELVPGQTLADRLLRGPLPFAEVIRIGLQVASALDRASQFDIVHGDVKPSNILEADSHTVKISDFGLSRRLSKSTQSNDRIAGTPNYLSPECVRGETLDSRSDIYSLGVTLYELTFGKLPFQLSGRTIRERLDAHLTQAPSFPEPWPESIPEAWRDVLQRMLAKNPADRYRNYSELMADLARLLPRRLIPAPRPSRAIAWLIDAILFTVMQIIVVGPAIVLQVIPGSPATSWGWIAAILGTFLSGILLLAVVWAQCRWSATPGKMLFQLGIVDAHGLRPNRRKLTLRVLFQFPWIGLFFSPLFSLIGLSFIENFLALAAFLMTLVSIGFFLIRRDQRSLHDILLRTQVVVQAGDD